MAKTQVNSAFAKPGLSHGRQYPLTASQSFTFAEVNEDAKAVAIVSLPINSIVLSGFLVVDTAWDTTGTTTISVGDSGSAARYLGATDLKTPALTALVPTGYKNTGGLDILVTAAVTSTADATAGAARLVVTYIIDNRANEVNVV